MPEEAAPEVQRVPLKGGAIYDQYDTKANASVTIKKEYQGSPGTGDRVRSVETLDGHWKDAELIELDGGDRRPKFKARYLWGELWMDNDRTLTASIAHVIKGDYKKLEAIRLLNLSDVPVTDIFRATPLQTTLTALTIAHPKNRDSPIGDAEFTHFATTRPFPRLTVLRFIGGTITNLHAVDVKWSQNLILLDLSMNQLEEFSPTLEFGPQLKQLNLSHNQILKFFPASGWGKHLVELDLSDNQITHRSFIDDFIGRDQHFPDLPELEYLNVSGNRLSDDSVQPFKVKLRKSFFGKLKILHMEDQDPPIDWGKGNLKEMHETGFQKAKGDLTVHL